MTDVLILESESADVARELGAKLQAWNEERIGPRNTRDITLFIPDEHGNVIGGPTGDIHWNALYVSVLWVADEYRSRGYGSALLNRAEAIAAESLCEIVFLGTMTFQAPEFYVKRGYQPFAQLKYGTRDFSRIWLAKRLG